MYVASQPGQASRTNGQLPTSNAYYLGTLRRNILAAVINNELFTDAEQLRTNHSVHECLDARKLALWLKNVRRVASEREQAQHFATFTQAIERGAVLVKQVPAATPTQCDELFALSKHPALTIVERAQTLILLPYYTQVQATATIGKLWARVLRRTGQCLGSDGSTPLAA